MRITRILPFALVCLAGCGGPSLVGKWSVSGDTKMPPGTKVTLDFTSSGFTQAADFTQMGIAIHVDTIGTYTFDGKKAKMTVTDLKFDDSKIPAQYKELAKSQFATQTAAAKGKTEEVDVKLDGDTATFTQKAGTVTLTKVK